MQLVQFCFVFWDWSLLVHVAAYFHLIVFAL